jgi:predicted HAD superfamily phosphohydrolase YqeG
MTPQVSIPILGGQLDGTHIVDVEPLMPKIEHINAINRTVEVYILTDMSNRPYNEHPFTLAYIFDPSLTKSAENY